MFNENEKITTIEQAKEFYTYMGCSGFYMCREYPERYEEYKKLNISRETEKAWRADQAKKNFKAFKKSSGEKAYLELHTYLEQVTFTKRNVKSLYRAIRKKYKTFKPVYIVLLDEGLCGYHTYFDDYCLRVVLKCNKILQNKYLRLIKEMCSYAVFIDSTLTERVNDIFSLKRKQENEEYVRDILEDLEEVEKSISVPK